MKKETTNKRIPVKKYTKPEVRKHKAVAAISGSGGGCDFSHSGANEYSYYH